MITLGVPEEPNEEDQEVIERFHYTRTYTFHQVALSAFIAPEWLTKSFITLLFLLYKHFEIFRDLGEIDVLSKYDPSGEHEAERNYQPGGITLFDVLRHRNPNTSLDAYITSLGNKLVFDGFNNYFQNF